MSYAGTVKEELYKHISSSRHCQLAELAAILTFNGINLANINDKNSLIIEIENELVARKCFTLLSKTFNICKCVNGEDDEPLKVGNVYRIYIDDKDEIRKIKEALSSELLLQKSCCMRAYLRGAFLTNGSVSDPNKSYHFEIVCHNKNQADKLREILSTFDIESKEILRKKYNVIYIKEGSLIVEALNVMEAHLALMDFENTRILKEMRNSVNRIVNCETANLNKTIGAALRQVENIRFIDNSIGLDQLPEKLREIARLRVEHRDVTLKELGERVSSGVVSKSGVNHRLRKIDEIADALRRGDQI